MWLLCSGFEVGRFLVQGGPEAGLKYCRLFDHRSRVLGVDDAVSCGISVGMKAETILIIQAAPLIEGSGLRIKD